jgi:DNA-binding MarR family transcriptional regulator
MDNAIGPDGKPRILYLIKRAHAAMSRATERGADGVTGVQMGALFVLTARGPILMKDLAAAIGVNNSAITGLVARMEEAGLAVRHAHETDGRAVLIAATPKGAKAAAAALPNVRALNAAALEGFNKAEIATIARFLTGLVEKLEDRTDQNSLRQNRRPK